MKKTNIEKKFSVIRRAQSFEHAGRGLWIFVSTTPNAWIQMFVFLCTFTLGLYLEISPTDWALICLASGLVFAAEAFNTAIEIDIDLTSPEFHPYARDTKDVAAGAVLIASIAALGIGLLVFVPYFI